MHPNGKFTAEVRLTFHILFMGRFEYMLEYIEIV